MKAKNLRKKESFVKKKKQGRITNNWLACKACGLCSTFSIVV